MNETNEINQQTTETDTTEVATQATDVTTPSPEGTGSSNSMRNYAIAGFAVLLIGGGLLFVLEQQGRVSTGIFSRMIPDASAATVNGVKISRTEFDRNRNQIGISASQQGADLTDTAVAEQISTQAIDTLINTELLRQAANEAGITIATPDIEARYAEIVESVGGPEALLTRMQEIGITEESLRKDIEGEILIQQLFAKEIDATSVAITDEEIQQVYEQAGGVEAGLPPLADVRSEIETNIRFTKEQELVTAYIETLRATADIKIHIK